MKVGFECERGRENSRFPVEESSKLVSAENRGFSGKDVPMLYAEDILTFNSNLSQNSVTW